MALVEIGILLTTFGYAHGLPVEVYPNDAAELVAKQSSARELKSVAYGNTKLTKPTTNKNMNQLIKIFRFLFTKLV